MCQGHSYLLYVRILSAQGCGQPLAPEISHEPSSSIAPHPLGKSPVPRKIDGCMIPDSFEAFPPDGFPVFPGTDVAQLRNVRIEDGAYVGEVFARDLEMGWHGPAPTTGEVRAALSDSVFDWISRAVHNTGTLYQHGLIRVAAEFLEEVVPHTNDYEVVEMSATSTCRGEPRVDRNSGRHRERTTLMWLWMNTEFIADHVLAATIIEWAESWHPYVQRCEVSDAITREAATVFPHIIRTAEVNAFVTLPPCAPIDECPEPRVPDASDVLYDDDEQDLG